jgi:plastocyanin
MKKFLLPYALLILLACLSTACASTPGAGSSDQTPTVHMSETQFVPTSITIQKGDRLTLVDDVAVVHIIANGRWDSYGNQRPDIEPGAPSVQAQFNGNDQQSIGPFTTVGTFHLYCTIHNNMNLTVVVRP